MGWYPSLWPFAFISVANVVMVAERTTASSRRLQPANPLCWQVEVATRHPRSVLWARIDSTHTALRPTVTEIDGAVARGGDDLALKCGSPDAGGGASGAGRRFHVCFWPQERGLHRLRLREEYTSLALALLDPKIAPHTVNPAVTRSCLLVDYLLPGLTLFPLSPIPCHMPHINILNPLGRMLRSVSTALRSWSLLASNLSCMPDGHIVGPVHGSLGPQQGHWDLGKVPMAWISGRPVAADRALPYSLIHLVGDSTVENLCRLLGVPAQRIEDPERAATAGPAGVRPIKLCEAGSRGRWNGVEVCCTAIKGEFPRGARMLHGAFEAAGLDDRRKIAVVFNEAGLWQVKHTPLELFNKTFPTLLDATLGLPANVDVFWVRPDKPRPPARPIYCAICAPRTCFSPVQCGAELCHS